MSRDRRHPPTRSGANASLTAPAPALEPLSPLPRTIEPSVRPGTYGMGGPHVPVAAYVAPLPPDLTEASPASALRVVTEDPLAFLAKQAAAQAPASPGAPTPPTPAGNRFRSSQPDADARRAPAPRRTSVPPPGFR